MIETVKITSRDNARLKNVRKVRDGKEPALILVEGIRLSEEARQSGLSIRDCFISTKALGNGRVRAFADAISSEAIIHEVSPEAFRSISNTENPQGLLLICDRPACSREIFEANLLTSKGRLPLVLFIEEVNNPSNLGAIMRTAEAAGARGVMVSKNSADVFSPKALRASMGSAFRLPVWFGADLDQASDWARERKMQVTAADKDGDKTYTQVNWNEQRLLVFGSEAHGLSKADKTKIGDMIVIPIDPNVESLNLAVSAGVVLFEAKRQVDSLCGPS